MKKILRTGVAILTLAALMSCGGNSNQKNNENEKEQAEKKTVLVPKTTKVKGDLSEYFEVVEKEYQLKDDTYSKMITITLMRKDKELPDIYKEFKPVGYFGAGVMGNYGFGIKIFDENEDQVLSIRADVGGTGGVYSSDDLKDLWDLEKGETGIVRWMTYDLDECTGKLTFTITSYAQENEDADEDSNEDDDEEEEEENEDVDEYSYDDEEENTSYSDNSSSSNDWDSILDDYEDIMKRYIKALKRAEEGDASAYTEMTKLLQDITEFATKLDGASDMTTKQAQRYAEINLKLYSY